MSNMFRHILSKLKFSTSASASPAASTVSSIPTLPHERLFYEFATDSPSTVVGRSWKFKELSLKSFDDLHKLWYVLLKEKNRLKTLQDYCKTKHAHMPNYSRMKKVCQSMARIKHVIGNRNKDFKEAKEQLEKQEDRQFKAQENKLLRMNRDKEFQARKELLLNQMKEEELAMEAANATPKSL